MEVACIFDVQPLASRPPVESQGSRVAVEGPSAAKGTVNQPFTPFAPRTSGQFSSPGKVRKSRGRASSPYQRGVGIRPRPVVIPPPPVVSPPQTDISGALGAKGHPILASPLSPPPVSRPGKPRFASPDSTDRKGTRALMTLVETDEDFELGSNSTPRAPRKSREKTRATEGSPNTPTTTRIAPLVDELGRECEKLKSFSVQQKMDLAELRDDLHDLRACLVCQAEAPLCGHRARGPLLRGLEGSHLSFSIGT
jgi:hypothetical protein